MTRSAILILAAFLIPAGCQPESPGDASGVVESREASMRAEAATHGSEATRGGMPLMETFVKPTEEELRRRLTPIQFEVTQRNGTERAFANEYYKNKEDGIYVDVVSGAPLFSSLDKFDSGTGWPSFVKPVDPGEVVEVEDSTHGMVRTEVRSRLANSHLGHVFDDGPADRGCMRYCINSAALRFVPLARMAEEGYEAYLAPFVEKGLYQPETSAADRGRGREEALLAGGCFWGMQEIIREIPGVIETDVGYTGGDLVDPKYEDLKGGRSGHAEAIRIVFDPAVLSYEELLMWFFRMHDPTTRNRQGNDIGSQYRSAIFYKSDAQRATAEKVIAAVSESGRWAKPIVTEVVSAKPYYPAEEYHQDYLQKNPGGYTCHFLRW